MDSDSWVSLCVLLENAFKGELPDVKRATYREFLDGCDPTEVHAALHHLVLRGQTFLPTPAEILGAMRELSSPPPPTTEEVLAALRAATRVWMRNDSEPEAIEWLQDNAHPAIVEFARRYTITRFRLLGVDDPDQGRFVVKQLMDSFREAQQQQESLLLQQGTSVVLDFPKLLPKGAGE